MYLIPLSVCMSLHSVAWSMCVCVCVCVCVCSQDLIREGERLEREQQLVKEHKLSEEYLNKAKLPDRFKGGRSLLGFRG